MEIIVDNRIINLLAQKAPELTKIPFISEPGHQLSFRWPSLLSYLRLGTLFSSLPAFDESQPLFPVSVTMLCENEDKEILYYVFDRLFTENLNQIKNLPQIQAPFLLQTIKTHRQTATDSFLSEILAACETAFEVNTAHTMHDLILYLAWDRMCVCMARLFDHQSTDSKFLNGINVLKECLLESYQHITQQGMTTPGIYRMLESFYFYEMREENLQKLSEADWEILNQSSRVLKEPEELADFFYIDDAVVPAEAVKSEADNSMCYLTMESNEKIHARLALAQLMMRKLQWNYVLQPKDIVCLT